MGNLGNTHKHLDKVKNLMKGGCAQVGYPKYFSVKYPETPRSNSFRVGRVKVYEGRDLFPTTDTGNP